MKINFERFKASDGVELQGWFSDVAGDAVVIHVHGMSGNGYENYFLDNLRKTYIDFKVSFFTFDNRGRGIISWFRGGDGVNAWGEGEKIGGSCYELFAESSYDIQGAIDFMRSKGKSKFILQGHSLGSTKVVNYLLNNTDDIPAAILLAPTDMVGWAKTDPNNQKYLAKAHQLLAQGKPEELVSASCWLDKTPLSAQTYPTICERNTPVDIYGPREDGALLGKVAVPMVIIYGDKDIGIEEIDGNINAWEKRASKVINSKTKIEIIPGADHGFAGHEDKLAEISGNHVRLFLAGYMQNS